MDRLFAIRALAAAAAAPLSACREKASDKKSDPAGAPAASAPLTFEELQKSFPESLAGMPRQIIVPTPEIPQASAYYQTEGNTRSGHVVYTLLSDRTRTLKDWERDFPKRSTLGGRTVYTRTYTLKNSPETAQGCLVVGERISACVDLTPGALADLPALFAEVPIAELAERTVSPRK